MAEASGLREAEAEAKKERRVAIMTPTMTHPVAPGEDSGRAAATTVTAAAAAPSIKKSGKPRYKTVTTAAAISAAPSVPISATPPAISVAPPAAPAMPAPPAAPPAAPAAEPAIPPKKSGRPIYKKSVAPAPPPAPAPSLLEEAAEAVSGAVSGVAEAVGLTEAEPEPQAATKPKTRTKRVPKEPTDFPTFVKSRHKDPSRYIFTKEGDIAIKDGERVKKIAVLTSYRAPNPTEIAEAEAAQESTLEDVLAEIETTKRDLRDAIMTYRSSGPGAEASTIVSLNQRISELMSQKAAIEYPLRWIQVHRKENIADILLEEEFEKRKTAYEVIYLKRRTKTLQTEYVREFDPENTDELVTAALAAKRKGMIVFSSKEEENGALADNWLVDIVIDGTEYSSAIQAYYAIKAAALGNDAVRAKIMSTRSSMKVRRYAEMLGADTEDWLKQREQVLFKVQLAKFEQHEELGKMLDKTGNDKLVYANAIEKELGIGLAPTDPRLDEGRWLGKNVLGEVLVKVRAKLREGVAEAAATQPVTERAISAAEDAARTKAIIARRTQAKRGI